MAGKVWYRGEGVGIAPAKAGGMKHDFADGLYFADTIAGAEPFARRADDPANQRLYQVQVDMDAVKVLNLSTDSRWEKYLNEPFSPMGGGLSRRNFLTQMPSAEHYNSFFNGFLKANKIDLNQYDAVIGPLLQHGGNQMCVLHKGGQPSPLAVRLRNMWTPVGAAINLATPRGALKFNGKLGPGLKTLGGSLIAIAITLFLGWLLGKFMENIIRSEINRQLANLEPEVESKIKQNRAKVLFVLAEKRKAFAELRFSVATTTTPNFGPPGADLTISGQSGFPVVHLDDFQITDRELPKGGVADGSTHEIAGTYSRIDTNYFKATVEVTASDEEVALFRAYMEEINWYNQELTHPASPQDESRLLRDRNALQAKLNMALME